MTSRHERIPAAESQSDRVPEDVCGYVHDLTTVEDVGMSCCYRPALERGQRCIWHGDNDESPGVVFEEMLPEPGERLDGAHIPSINLIEEDAFEGCSLIGATFDSTVVRRSSFVDTDLREATLDDVDARDADFSGANLGGASIDGTDFRGVDFDSVRLDQAIISNTRVNRETAFGKTTRYERNLENAGSKDEYRKEAEAAVWTYREIHALFIANALPLQARTFYYKEKDTRRRLAWHLGNYLQAAKAEASRWVTGYGMNPYRVIGSAIVVILVCALIYPITGGIHETTGDRTATWSLGNLDGDPSYILYVLGKSVYFSSITFSTLGYGDISPVGTSARFVAGIESLLGALLTALLVFVLSRRIS